MDTITKMHNIENELNTYFVERDQEVPEGGKIFQGYYKDVRKQRREPQIYKV